MSHRDTVMARYVKFLDMPSRVVALIPVIFTLGLCVLQPISAVLLHDSRGRARRMAFIYCLMGVSFAMMAGAIFLPDSVGPVGHLVPYFGAYVGAMCCMGFGEPHYASLVYHTAPQNALGRIFTLYAAALGVGGIAGGCVCRFVLDRLTVPTSFGVLTLATAVGMALAGTPLLLFDDSRRGPSVTPPATLRVLLRERLRSFVARPGFVAYLAARTGIWLLLGCAPFITNHIRAELPSEGEAIVGELVVVMYVMMTFGSLASGWLADRVGFRPFLIAGLLLVGVGYGGLALVDLTRTSALALYGVTMMIWPVLVVGGTPYMRTIIPDARVTELVAVSAVLTCLPRIAVPLGLGYLRDAMDSYTPLLLCVTVLACLTAVMVYVAGGAIHRPGLGNGAP